MNNNVSPNTKSKKSKRKFNLIDFFIVIIILTLIAAVIYALSPLLSDIKKSWNTNEITLQYTVEFKNVDTQLKEKIESGDSVTNAVTKNAMGYVSEIEITKSEKLYYHEDTEGNITGVMVENEDGGQYDITVTIVSSSANFETDVGYSVNGTRIAIGEQLSLRFPDFSATGYCTSID